MEAKKNPAKDVHRLRGMFFQIGLAISLSIVIIFIEWSSEFQKPKLRTGEGPPVELLSIPVTSLVEPPPPSPIKSEIKPFIPKNFNPVIDETSSKDETQNDNPSVDAEPLLSSLVFTIEEDSAENIERIWTFVEDPATPVGGYKAFYNLLRKNLKYPPIARKYDIEGKVTVEFVINKDGTPVDFKSMHGVGYGCDEEAIRVLKLLKWNPGKQRGNAVRVKMVLPVIFKLN